MTAIRRLSESELICGIPTVAPIGINQQGWGLLHAVYYFYYYFVIYYYYYYFSNFQIYYYYYYIVIY